MSSSLLTILDSVEKTATKLNFGVNRRSSKIVGVELARRKAYSECLKLLLPVEFKNRTFGDFDRHLSFIEQFYEERNFEWIRNNLEDIMLNDLPYIKQEVYYFVEKKKAKEKIVPLSNRVFIVHGRDTESLKELKTMLSGFGLNPIVLHEQPSGSRTIVEKLEKYSDVGYAFVILTPDDVGGAYKDKKILRFEGKKRARQNVVLEFGYFIGLLGRDRVCCLYKGDVELPSDMHGIVYISFKESVNDVRNKIIKELKAAGYDIRI